ncbi:MAG: hypothetical protein ACRDNS_35930, partial [Trebonia sp.]
ASGATGAIRELGGVLGVAVLATVFTSHGGYASPQAFVNGLVPAMWVGTVVLGVGALIPLLLPFNTRATALEHAALERDAGSSERGTGPRRGVGGSKRERPALGTAPVGDGLGIG